MLKLTSVFTGYGGTMVTRGVSLEITDGEIVSLIGRNGVGKSTLARAIIGLQPVASGSITFDGQEVTKEAAYRRAQLGVGYVPQGRGIFADLTVEENLRVGKSIGNKPGSFDDVFSLFPILMERRSQLGGTLSGGQQQMLAIGRVLMGNPKLLLLDEPSDGIQPSIIDMLSETLLRLNNERGLTTLLIEQNLDFIMACSNRCYVMEKGSLVAELEAEALADAELARRYLAI